MIPLIDGDVILYEIGFAAEAGWSKDGGDPPPWEYVEEILMNRIGNICALAGATEPPVIFFTGKTNFRNEIAKRQPYKNRPSNKPFHYYNIKAYLKAITNWRETEGLEADDLISMELVKNPENTICCTRDKDLRTVPGWHYGWELNNQPSFGPALVDELGWIKLNTARNKVSGVGGLFFYAQCIMGDRVDSIPGLDRIGAVGAFEILEGSKTLEDAFKRVLEAYRGVYGDNAEVELLEQGRLLHMTRKLNEDGSPVLWELPNGLLQLQEGARINP